MRGKHLGFPLILETIDGEWRDHILTELLREDWEETRNKAGGQGGLKGGSPASDV